jgi:chromosome partitioning protein
MNEKGGSAKTTLAANVAAYLALERGRRVLAVDLDPQGQLGKVLGLDTAGARRTALELVLGALCDDPLDAPGPDADERRTRGPSERGDLPIRATRIDRLDAIVSNKALGLVPTLESGEDDPTSRLARALDRSVELRRYDYALFDCPPSFGPLTLSVLRAVDELVVPVPLTVLALDGCAELMRTLATIRTRFGRSQLAVTMVVPTFYRRTRLAHEVLERLKTRFPKEIASIVVGYHVKIDEAQSRGLSIFEYAPGDRGAHALAAVAQELEARAPAPHGAQP